MRIYSLTKVLVLPVVAALAALVYYHYVLDVDMGMYLLIPILILVVMYVSMPYVDFWFLKKYPIPLDPEITDWLTAYSPFYNSLSEVEREKYHYRMTLYLDVRAFKAVGAKHRDLPEDIKAIIASNAIQIAWNKEDYLIGDYDRIFVYKHPFPTPRHQFLHCVETQAEDGVIIYSLEHLVPGMINPSVYYNIGMHAYVEAFLDVHKLSFDSLEHEGSWDDIIAISGLSQDLIQKTIGYELPDLLPILMTCYFTYPVKFEERLPKLSAELNQKV